MNEDFRNRSNTKRNEYLLKTEELFVANKNKWVADFTEHFQLICAEIARLQNEGLLPAISYMEYTMLYANFINRRYIAEVYVYKDESYLDDGQHMVGEYDISFLFYYYEKLWDSLLLERKRYVGKVTAREITSFMLETLPDFYSYLTIIARSAIVECIETRPYTTIKKNEDFIVSVGNYMAFTEPVFTESKNKKADKLVKWFSGRLDKEYIFGDYSGLDFSEHSFTFTDFRYSQFCHSCLNGVSFYNSDLSGANYHNASMEKCNMENSSIYEADFSHAFLKKANFTNTCGKAGLPDDKQWRFAGFLPVSFRYADLTGADLMCANLAGADFTGAILKDADLTNANLSGTDFTDTVLDGAFFTNAVLDDAIIDLKST